MRRRTVRHTIHGVGYALLGVLGAVAVVGAPLVALAQPATVELELGTIGDEIGLLPAEDPRVLIARIVRFFLGFLGLIAVGINLYGGWLWMTSRGNAEQIDTARKVLTNGAIGLVIILVSFSVVSFLLNRLLGGAGGGGGQPGGLPPPCENCFAVGAGIIEDHFPARDQAGLPKNTSIIITFKEPVLVEAGVPAGDDDSLLADAVAQGDNIPGLVDASGSPVVCTVDWCGRVNPAVLDVNWDPADGSGFQDVTDFLVLSTDGRTFVYSPTEPLPVRGADTYAAGESTDTDYRVRVFDRLTKADGQPAFGAFANQTGLVGYQWRFGMADRLDTRAPQIERIEPADDDTTFRNTLIQVTFDEPVNPVSVTGVFDPAAGEFFSALQVTDVTGAPTPLVGSFALGNGYRTVEFRSFDSCGVNACGDPMFCLPSIADLSVDVLAATLWSDPGCGLGPDIFGNPSRACSPSPLGGIFDGVVDTASNSLDGERNEEEVPPGSGNFELLLPSGNGTADGPPADTFTFGFQTNDTILSTGPTLSRVLPAPAPDAASSGVSPNATIEGRFTRKLALVGTYTDRTGVLREPFRLYEQDQTTSAWSVPPDIGYPLTQQPVRVCENNPGQECVVNADCGDPETDPTARCVGECAISTGTLCKKNVDCPLFSPQPGDPGNPLDVCGIGEDVFVHQTGLKDPNDPASGFTGEVGYEARFGSGVRDVYQNCFYESVGPTNNVVYQGFCANNGNSCTDAADCDPGVACVATPPPWPDRPITPF